jgi:hypothetical protein
MAQKTRVILVDDIDGEEITDGGETLQFGLDGVTYEIDLNDKNAAKLRDALSFYIAHARRVGGRRQTSRSGGGTASARGSDLQKIREWAKENGYKVSDRGRISKEVQEAYAAAH